MKLNDQNSNSQLTIFPSAYNTNMTAAYKYLSRESSVMKNDKSILKSPSSNQLYCASNRGSDKKVRIQESASKGSIQFKNSAQFGRTSTDLIQVPPMRSLNREDREKLIATLIQQVKQQNQLIIQLEDKASQQAEQLDELNLYNEKYEQKEKCYGEIIQNQNKINQRIHQIAELRELEFRQTNDHLDILNQIYEDEVDMDMAIKWRNARLKFNFLDALSKAAKYSKKLNKIVLRKQNQKLKECFKGWKYYIQNKSLLTQFNEVRNLRIVINFWMKWKQQIQDKKEYCKNLKTAIQFNNQNLKTKCFGKLKQNYLKYNFSLKDFQQITQSAIDEFKRIKLFKVFSQWILWIKKENQKQQIIYQHINNGRTKMMKGVIRFLKQNCDFHKERANKIVKQRVQTKVQKLFNQLKQNWKQNKYRENQIKLNRNFFIKFRQVKKWIREYQKLSRLNQISIKVVKKREIQFLQGLFDALKNNAYYRKMKRQNEILLNKKYDNRVLNWAFMHWLSNLLKKKNLLVKEQNVVILKQKDIDYQQQNDVQNLKQMYNSVQQELGSQEEQINNYKILISNQKEVEHQLQMQYDYLKQELVQTKDQLVHYQIKGDEVRILKEQYTLAQQQLKELRMQKRLGSPIRNLQSSGINGEQDQLRKQVEISSTLLNDQKQEYNSLQMEYSKVVGDYEKKIKDIEKYFVDLCDKQKLQIERLLKENQSIKIENQQNVVSRNKLMDELNMIHESFREEIPQQHRTNFQTQDSYEQQQYGQNQRLKSNLYSQTSPISVNQYSQNSPQKQVQIEDRIKEEAYNLREDIKRRLASLKTQMDCQL
ncbi:unnamed protein product (macronuclear) [Paramecium tetraurelia]|uniref:Sfi1 spindle body domain-containing protein n=1 Tax=Paramecium tetraurelia TaxID=5888 RepID=A0CHS6_PARTE|nr:uncharacterized protein GSPATT00038445001 [Paramecium tetraurelia]CAK70343.1 unnamed protein product [Paramecium tetraurelia]|eukprot:XP_001437740.1 hypothetical protein (macronuclear) [Paramecium tetraurelia strain d4-2]